MNVGIQESEHFEGIYPVIRLFDTGHHQLFIFVNEKTHQQLLGLLGARAEKFHWIIQAGDESTYSFCRRIRKTVLTENLRLLYLNTISKHHLWFALLLPPENVCRTILTVHDVNCMFRERLTISPRSWIRWLGKHLLVNKVSAFNTVSETVKPYLASKAKKHQPVYTVPGAVYEKPARFNNSGKLLKLVIPGSVDSKRRDYRQVFQMLDLMGNLPIEIILLGGGSGVYARAIWAECRQRNLPNLVWFETDLVNQEIFDEYMDAAHFIWVPSVVETTICGDIPETYGITKSSGNIFDIIKHAKPFLYPQSLQVPSVLAPAGIKYSSVELLIEALGLQAPDSIVYAGFVKAATAAAENFTIENQRALHAPLFDQA